MVSTKLPHYSASIYIPLSMFVAFSFLYAEQEKQKFPLWVVLLFVALGTGLGCLFLAIPSVLNEYAALQLVDFTFPWSAGIWITGIAVAVCFPVAGFFLFRDKLKSGLVVTALAMMIFTQGLWRFHLPSFIVVHQQPLLNLVSEVHRKEKPLVFYRMVSFAAFFYGKKPIEVLHNYKFSGDPAILDIRHEEPVYIIAGIENKDRLLTEHPLAEYEKSTGKFALFVIRAKKLIPD